MSRNTEILRTCNFNITVVLLMLRGFGGLFLDLGVCVVEDGGG